MEFSSIGTDSIVVVLECPKCDYEVRSESINVPAPILEAEKIKNSYNDNDGYAICENCGEEFDIIISAGFINGNVEVVGCEVDFILEITESFNELEEYYENQIDSILTVSNSYDLFSTEINNLSKLNQLFIENEELLVTLQRQVFSGVITCMEDYLSTRLIKKILTNEENFKNFVKTNPKIIKRKFNLNEIYEELAKIRDTVKFELLNVIYHDLPKVRLMYQESLKIHFPPIDELIGLIQKRHDIVHRNGKNKEGVKIEMSREVVDSILDTIEDFIMLLETTINSNDK
jgi:transcription elongation factor Elf1